MTEFFSKFPYFYLGNEKIQSGFQNNIYFLKFSRSVFSREFPHSKDKRAGISKNFMLFSILFLTIFPFFECTVGHKKIMQWLKVKFIKLCIMSCRFFFRRSGSWAEIAIKMSNLEKMDLKSRST